MYACSVNKKKHAHEKKKGSMAFYLRFFPKKFSCITIPSDNCLGELAAKTYQYVTKKSIIVTPCLSFSLIFF